jgi:FixJ family two-component response regulator
MLTAHGDSKVIADAINEGAVYKFLLKPWDNDLLRETVRQAFIRHRTRAAAYGG